MKREVKTESLTKYLFDAPKWQVSLAAIILLGLAVDGVVFLFTGEMRGIGFVFLILQLSFLF